MPTTETDHPLGAFLRAIRERLQPSDVGLPPGQRRRTPGLRREEAALLCGISPTWYTWIEQGRARALSAPTLVAIADGLRLSRAERHYLFQLAARADPAPAEAETDAHALAPLLAAMQCPAYLLDRHWDVVESNGEARRLFAGWLDQPAPQGHNLLRFVFLDTRAPQWIVDWPERARRLTAEFRADSAALRHDPVHWMLVEQLNQGSEAFRRLWAAQEVLEREGGLRRFRRPDGSEQRFRQYTLQVAKHPQLKLVTLIAENEELGRRLAGLELGAMGDEEGAHVAHIGLRRQ
ncbi:MAG: helix-turn-helix domain-containing protein [Paludibacterium sp.]|uniref:helix-turn-helix transcriptional regulator n=1 Tax=Paludibacterium sp. TaxID=1917523 RepID=UPI0025D9FE24|nr:helix-turn-helix transcriptional regulator [Paludibacterium sp.]MBV8046184.1 helix-turn-helix domain-containing protein [Paludibacterium sp.]